VDGAAIETLLYGERGLHAFEVKRTAVFRESDLAGLRLFCGDYPMARGHLLYGGTKRYRYGAIDVVPFGEGLQALAETLGAKAGRVRKGLARSIARTRPSWVRYGAEAQDRRHGTTRTMLQCVDEHCLP
jgi:hypothetical protein